MIRFILLLIFSLLILNTYSQSYYDSEMNSILRQAKKNLNCTDPGLKSLKGPKNELEEIYQIMSSQSKTLRGYLYIARVNTCRSGGCNKKSSAESANEMFEYFDYYLITDHNMKVKKVKVFNYQATHGYEITASGWLKQFEDYTGDDSLLVGRDIDGITGATKSVYSITHHIQTAVLKIKESGK